MRVKFAILAFASALFMSGSARAQIVGSCADALQFDQIEISQNFAAKLSVLDLVNLSNYEQFKKNLSATVPGYFNGNFSEFSERRDEFRRSFKLDSSTQLSSNFFQRTLSSAGAEAYGKCVAAASKVPLFAYVSSGHRSEYVSVTIISNLAGNSKLKISIVLPDYIRKLSDPEPLLSGSKTTVFFQAPLGKPFLVNFNGADEISGASYSSDTLEIPPYVEFKETSQFRDYTAIGRCGAGGNGSTTGSPLRESVYFAAEAGYKLMPETVTLKSKTHAGGQSIVRDPSWTWTRMPNQSERPDTMRGDPDSCEGSSPHTQAIAVYQFSIRAVSRIIAKVDH
jgi:hypothetical protein